MGIELISAVKKLDSGNDGLFASIQNDLATYVEEVGENEDALRLMAYGYARRVAAAGLFLQGIWGRSEHAHNFEMFKGLQDITQNRMGIESGSQEGIDFQNKAAKQAADLLESYDPRLTFQLIGLMLSVVESGNVPEQEVAVPDEFVFALLEPMQK